MNSYHNSFKKRFLDLFLILLICPIAIPLLLVSVLLILVFNGTPAFYFQERVGKDGKIFKMYKLRTMKRKFKNHGGTIHKDDDITVIGKLLRITRMDEFPQIINILKGQMSWVGPRPEVPFYVDVYAEKDSSYNLRHRVLPGITGLAQVEHPNATPNDNLVKLAYDLQYIEKASLQLDLRLFFASFLAVFK
jgi:lipopolysaccharide/colanic/teichoic acid biosynthesis glycosyltransferase